MTLLFAHVSVQFSHDIAASRLLEASPPDYAERNGEIRTSFGLLRARLEGLIAHVQAELDPARGLVHLSSSFKQSMRELGIVCCVMKQQQQQQMGPQGGVSNPIIIQCPTITTDRTISSKGSSVIDTEIGGCSVCSLMDLYLSQCSKELLETPSRAMGLFSSRRTSVQRVLEPIVCERMFICMHESSRGSSGQAAEGDPMARLLSVLRYTACPCGGWVMNTSACLVVYVMLYVMYIVFSSRCVRLPRECIFIC
jgi:hypothetical protein